MHKNNYNTYGAILVNINKINNNIFIFFFQLYFKQLWFKILNKDYIFKTKFKYVCDFIFFKS